MIGKGLWFAAGAAAGVYGTMKAKRVAEAFTVDGVRHRAKGMALGARMFREEVTQGQAAAELELRERFAHAVAGKHRAIDPADDPESTPGLATPSLVARERHATSNDTQEDPD